MTCANFWSGLGYWKLWEDAEYFYAIDRQGGVTLKILKSAVCHEQPPTSGGTGGIVGGGSSTKSSSTSAYLTLGAIGLGLAVLFGGKT